jgi:Sec-independent protein translocase protein TatA
LVEGLVVILAIFCVIFGWGLLYSVIRLGVRDGIKDARRDLDSREAAVETEIR